MEIKTKQRNEMQIAYGLWGFGIFFIISVIIFTSVYLKKSPIPKHITVKGVAEKS